MPKPPKYGRTFSVTGSDPAAVLRATEELKGGVIGCNDFDPARDTEEQRREAMERFVKWIRNQDRVQFTALDVSKPWINP